MTTPAWPAPATPEGDGATSGQPMWPMVLAGIFVVGFFATIVVAVGRDVSGPERSGGSQGYVTTDTSDWVSEDTSFWRTAGYEFADGVIEVDGERDSVRVRSDCDLKASLLDLGYAETGALMAGCSARIAEGMFRTETAPFNVR